jgi:hypothetical protein
MRSLVWRSATYIPLYGGSMYNAIVELPCKSSEASGFVVLHFNFKGVGASEGSYDQGVKQGEDARAALDFLKSISLLRVTRLGITGYSLGLRSCPRSDGRAQCRCLGFDISSPCSIWLRFLEDHQKAEAHGLGKALSSTLMLYNYCGGFK